MKMNRKLLINGKELKVLAAKALNINYEKICIEYEEEKTEFIIEVQQGSFIEQVSFSDKRILKELKLKELNLEIDYVTIYENEYAFKTDATDEQRVYVFYCNELVIGSAVA